MKIKKVCEDIMDRFFEAVHFKITRDIHLYGICKLEVGNADDLDEIIEIRKKLDKSINFEDMMKKTKSRSKNYFKK